MAVCFSEKTSNLIFQLNFNFKMFWKKEASAIELISVEGWKVLLSQKNGNIISSYLYTFLIFFSGKLNLHICSWICHVFIFPSIHACILCVCRFTENWGRIKAKAFDKKLLYEYFPYVGGFLLQQSVCPCCSILYVTDYQM